jgi:hypothetical protein
MIPELTTTVITLLIVQPLLAGVEESRIHEYPRLDNKRFFEKVRQSHDLIQILDFYLFPSSIDFSAFAKAIDQAIRQHDASVRIVLIDPESPAAQQRAQEIKADIGREVHCNLRDLATLQESLPPTLKDHLEVRICETAPGIQVYGWGERMLVSFYPLGKLSQHSAQLEIPSTQSLGSFITERFDALWGDNGSRPASSLLTKSAYLLIDGMDEYLENVKFIKHDRVIYLYSQEAIEALASKPDSILVRLDDGSAQVYDIGLVSGTSERELLGHLSRLYSYKYGIGGHTGTPRPIRLTPVGSTREAEPVTGQTVALKDEEHINSQRSELLPAVEGSDEARSLLRTSRTKWTPLALALTASFVIGWFVARGAFPARSELVSIAPSTLTSVSPGTSILPLSIEPGLASAARTHPLMVVIHLKASALADPAGDDCLGAAQIRYTVSDNSHIVTRSPVVAPAISIPPISLKILPGNHRLTVTVLISINPMLGAGCQYNLDLGDTTLTSYQ